MGFAEAVLKLSQIGFFQFFAPFALVFLLSLGILFRYKPFGDWKNNTTITMIYGIVSFLMALFVMLYGLNVYIEMFLAWVLGRAGILIIFLLVILIFAAFLKGGESLGGG